MCRHLCYLGEPARLDQLLIEPRHSLVVQAHAPKDMRGGGTVNADGFGIGWFDGANPTAARYRRSVPIWQDPAVAELAGRVCARTVLAAVRNATVGMPVTETAAAPFTDGRWLFSLNGRIDGWPDSAEPLAATLARRDLLTMESPTDAALLWLVLRQRLSSSQADPAAILRDLVLEVLDRAPGSRLNLLLTDGHRAYASAVTHSLWSRWHPSGVVLASEPFDDDPQWRAVPDGRLVVADRAGVEVSSLRSTARTKPVESSKIPLGRS